MKLIISLASLFICLLVILILMFKISRNSLQDAMELKFPSYKPPQRKDDCLDIARESQQKLLNANISVSCSLLHYSNNCNHLYDDLRVKADPFNVYLRSSVCDLDMPKFSVVSSAEKNFPLAYFITAFTDSRNFEQLLSIVFRPHNAYCIHVDPKADPLFINTVKQIIFCYKQLYPEAKLFLSSGSVPVYWGHFSIVEAELICLSDLLALDVQWKYAIDLAGSELVLLTNKEMVEFLSSSETPEIYVESFPLPEMNRVQRKDKLFPFNMTIYKGAKSYRLPRSFVEFLLNHPVSLQFIHWSKTTYIPDETVIPTLARISNTIKGENGWIVKQEYIPRPRYHLQNRAGWLPCHSSWRNMVCIFSLKDLYIILQSGAHIINKFLTDRDPYIGQCIVEIVESKAVRGG